MSALSRRTILRRAAAFLAWLVAFVASMWVVGILATTALLVIGYMRIGAKEGWFVVLAQAILLTLLVYIVFDQLLATPWPQTLIGQWLPALRSIPSI